MMRTRNLGYNFYFSSCHLIYGLEQENLYYNVQQNHDDLHHGNTIYNPFKVHSTRFDNNDFYVDRPSKKNNQDWFHYEPIPLSSKDHAYSSDHQGVENFSARKSGPSNKSRNKSSATINDEFCANNDIPDEN